MVIRAGIILSEKQTGKTLSLGLHCLSRPFWQASSVQIFRTSRVSSLNTISECKIVIIFLFINFNLCLGAQKNHLIERVLLSTHKMFWLRNKKINFNYLVLS